MSEPADEADKAAVQTTVLASDAAVQMTVLASDPDTAWFTCTAVKLPTRVAIQIIKLMEDARATMHQSH